MKIGIDARFLTHPQAGGFKTYTKNLISELVEIGTDNEYVLYLDRQPDDQTYLPQHSNFSTCVLPGTAPLIGMVWREQNYLSRQVRRDKLDLLHSPCLTAPLRPPCPLVVTIHDMIWYFPAKRVQSTAKVTRRQLMTWYYRWVPKIAMGKAEAVITVSHAAKNSIVHSLGLPADQIFVTYEAAGKIFHQIGDQDQLSSVRKRYNLSLKYILAIGSADPRKNLRMLLLAYANLPADLQEQYQLVIIWTHTFLSTELFQLVDSLSLQGCVRFVQGVGDEDLVCLYNAASLFAFPSLYEGFGLPPLEAMACGTPVIAANNSSIPEIVGDAAILFDAENDTSIADAMSRVLADQALQAALIKKGLKRSTDFSWAKCAHDTLEVYNKVLAG